MKKKLSINILVFIICFTLSLLVYFTFRIHLKYNFDFSILISFIFIQIPIWSVFFFLYKKKLLIFGICSILLILINFASTPVFHIITADMYRTPPNYFIERTFTGDFFKGIFFENQVITSDEKGFRINKKKINYEDKNKNTLRIISIGGSTTAQPNVDDSKTWSNLVGEKISNLTNKEVEVINTGVMGLRAKHHYLSLERIKKYKPDLIVFLMGINDWTYHIVNREKEYLFPYFEIGYDYKKSILHKSFGNINKQLRKKIAKVISKEPKKNDGDLIDIFPTADTENPVVVTGEYFEHQMDSLNKRTLKEQFEPKNISEDYKFWANKIIKECNKNKLNCIFMDQPSAYSKKISKKLKSRLWMTPPQSMLVDANKEIYTLSFENLIHISSLYNNWLKKEVIRNNLNFCTLSEKIPPNTEYLYDDCHFSENGSKKVSEVLFLCINSNFNFLYN